MAATFVLFAASSCKKKCVQCEARYSDGKLVTGSQQKVCESKFNGNFYEKVYRSSFSGYDVTCVDAE